MRARVWISGGRLWRGGVLAFVLAAGAAVTAPMPAFSGISSVQHIAGRVYDAAVGREAGVAGADIMVRGQSLWSDAAGDFAFDLQLAPTDVVHIGVYGPTGWSDTDLDLEAPLLTGVTSLDIGLQRLDSPPTPTPIATTAPTPWRTGDLGIKHVGGRVYGEGGGSDAGIAGATVSYGAGVATTDANGDYAFDIFVHDTDAWTLRAEAPGYIPLERPYTGAELWFAGRVDFALALTIAEPTATPFASPQPTDACPSQIAVEPDAPVAGQSVSVSGRCYYVHSGATVRVLFDGTLVGSGHGDTIGNYDVDIQIPQDAEPGSYVITTTTAQGSVVGSGTVDVVSDPTPTPTPRPDHLYRVIGLAEPDVDCMAPGLPQLTVRLDAVLGGVAARTLTLTSGGPFTFDDVAEGDYVVSVQSTCPLSLFPSQRVSIQGRDGGVDLAAERCPVPILVDPDHGAPGTAVKIAGRCYYAHSGIMLRILFDGAPIATATGNTEGAYHTTFDIPGDATLGAHTIRATYTSGGPVLGSGAFSVGVPADVCLGDCNDDGAVRIDELLTLVRIALGDAAVTACQAALPDGAETIDIATLVAAVGTALDGCAAAAPTAAAPFEAGVCFQGPACTRGSGPPEGPITTTRAYCCTRQAQLGGVAVRWCAAEDYDDRTGSCSVCEAPC